MKKLFTFIILLLTLLLVYYKKDDINKFIVYNFIIDDEIKIEDANEYKLNYNLVNTETDYIVSSYNELITIIYNIVNNGWENFNFYCDKNYNSCITDLETIINNKYILSDINNLVHPFNSYNSINFSYNNYGEITINIIKVYNKDDINIINENINKILNEIIENNNSTNDYQKIKIIHDYIINKTIYDSKKANFISKISDIDSNYKSNIAYGPLIEGYGICSGYTDLMAIFLNKLGIPNYKLSSENHTWNYVYIDDTWLHLDLTWDDPVSSNNQNYLSHDMFLIDTNKLHKIDYKEHNFVENLLIK